MAQVKSHTRKTKKGQVRVTGHIRTDKRFNADKLRELWGSGKIITFQGKRYQVGKMSYGDYLLEPLPLPLSEYEKFKNGTLWLKRTKENPYFFVVDEDRVSLFDET